MSAEEIRQAVFGNGLMRRYETGQLSSREFYGAFCTAIGARPDYAMQFTSAESLADELRRRGIRFNL